MDDQNKNLVKSEDSARMCDKDELTEQPNKRPKLSAFGTDSEKMPETSFVSDKMYFRSYADITIHEDMIADRVRTSTYRYAILKNFEAIRGKVVLDIGAGTGILSMFCIHAGAKKVYAIEASEMAFAAEQLFKTNGVADKATVIKGKVEEVEVPEQVDVIVSEWMGYFLLYETMLHSVIHARDKWLKKGGMMLPQQATIYLAPVCDPELEERLAFWSEASDTYHVDLSCLRPHAARSLTARVSVHQVEPQDIMSHATAVCSLNLANVKVEDLRKVKGKFSFDCFGSGDVSGFVSWFDVTFPKGIRLTTSPYETVTHWQQSVLYLDSPISVEQGTIINGAITLAQNTKYHRFLDIDLKFQVGDAEEKDQHFLMDDFVS